VYGHLFANTDAALRWRRMAEAPQDGRHVDTGRDQAQPLTPIVDFLPLLVLAAHSSDKEGTHGQGG
jgi:hypothetical protein